MVQRTPAATAALYEVDETAWLEATADLIRSGRLTEVDLNTLAGYLTDMAKRDRREVFSRLVVLLSHLLKWEYQPDRRSGSWRGTVLEQQRELRQLLESGTLRNHATAVFAEAYADARKQRLRRGWHETPFRKAAGGTWTRHSPTGTRRPSRALPQTGRATDDLLRATGEATGAGTFNER